jgi:vacuolar-type H+-ATPase subunit D/Vma8
MSQKQNLTASLGIRIDAKAKVELMKKVAVEGKTASEVINEFILSYVSLPAVTPADVSRMHEDIETLKRKVEALEKGVKPSIPKVAKKATKKASY